MTDYRAVSRAVTDYLLDHWDKPGSMPLAWVEGMAVNGRPHLYYGVRVRDVISYFGHSPTGRRYPPRLNSLFCDVLWDSQQWEVPVWKLADDQVIAMRACMMLNSFWTTDS